MNSSTSSLKFLLVSILFCLLHGGAGLIVVRAQEDNGLAVTTVNSVINNMQISSQIVAMTDSSFLYAQASCLLRLPQLQATPISYAGDCSTSTHLDSATILSGRFRAIWPIYSPDGDDLYLTERDSGNVHCLVRKIDSTNGLWTVQGLPNGACADVDDTSGPDYTDGRLEEPLALVMIGSNDLYVGDRYKIKKIDMSSVGTLANMASLQTVAGSGTSGYLDGAALSANINSVRTLAVLGAKIYFSTSPDYSIRVFDPVAVTIGPVAGPTDGLSHFTYAHDGSGTGAEFNTIYAICSGPDLRPGFSSAGAEMLYVVEQGNHLVRMVDPGASPVTETLLAGHPTVSGDIDGPALSDAYLKSPQGCVFDRAEQKKRLIFGEKDVTQKFKALYAPGALQVVEHASRQYVPGSTPMHNIVILPTGKSLWFASTCIYVALTSSTAPTVTAGDCTTPGDATGPELSARFTEISSIVVPQDFDGDMIWIADSTLCLLRLINNDNTVANVAGGSGLCTHLDKDAASSIHARFTRPSVMSLSAFETCLYIGDQYRLRCASLTLGIQTVAGDGTAGHVDATGTAARFQDIRALSTELSGKVYIGTIPDGCIRFIVTATTVVGTLAGPTTGTASTSYVSDGTLSNARFNGVFSILLGPDLRHPDWIHTRPQVLYVADYENDCIRVIDITLNTEELLAGIPTINGDVDGDRSIAQFGRPSGLALDSTRRKVIFSDGRVTNRVWKEIGFSSTFTSSPTSSDVPTATETISLTHLMTATQTSTLSPAVTLTHEETVTAVVAPTKSETVTHLATPGAATPMPPTPPPGSTTGSVGGSGDRGTQLSGGNLNPGSRSDSNSSSETPDLIVGGDEDGAAGRAGASSSGLDNQTAIIIGASVGLVILLVVCVLFLVCCVCKKNSGEEDEEAAMKKKMAYVANRKKNDPNSLPDSKTTGDDDDDDDLDGLQHLATISQSVQESIDPEQLKAATAGQGVNFAFQKGKVIGSGGFGKVYLARNEKDGGLIAAKELNNHDNEKLLDELAREITNMKKLNHPHIVKYLGFEHTVDDQYYILMEYLAGGSLRSSIQSFGKLNHKVAARYTRQALLGLSYLHSRGIAHRDIKAANMLLDTEGVLKLSDLGAAQSTDGTLNFTGTPNWMAPELVAGKKELIGQPTDIWALGCTVMEMLTGYLPFGWIESMNGFGIMRMISQADKKPQPFTNALEQFKQMVGPHTPACWFVISCLVVDPAKRPTAQELLRNKDFLSLADLDDGSAGLIVPDTPKTDPKLSPMHFKPKEGGAKGDGVTFSLALSQGSAASPVRLGIDSVNFDSIREAPTGSDLAASNRQSPKHRQNTKTDTAGAGGGTTEEEILTLAELPVTIKKESNTFEMRTGVLPLRQSNTFQGEYPNTNHTVGGINQSLDVPEKGDGDGDEEGEGFASISKQDGPIDVDVESL